MNLHFKVSASKNPLSYTEYNSVTHNYIEEWRNTHREKMRSKLNNIVEAPASLPPLDWIHIRKTPGLITVKPPRKSYIYNLAAENYDTFMWDHL